MKQRKREGSSLQMISQEKTIHRSSVLTQVLLKEERKESLLTRDRWDTNGNWNLFNAKAFMTNAQITMIRPFVYIKEKDIVYAVNKLELPIVTNHCPANKHSQREWTKEFLHKLDKEIPGAKDNILGAIYNPDRTNLWKK